MPKTPSPKRVSNVVLSPYFNPAKTTTDSLKTLHERLIQLKPCLIQETVAGSPWKLLVAVTLLNKTSGKLAIPVFWLIMEKWPTAFALSQASEADLITLLHPLGTQNIRAKRLIDLSHAYLLDPPSHRDPRPSRATGPPLSPRKRAKYPPTPISHLPGAGAYALDSYRIFCAGDEWKDVNPSDKELVRYLRWKWAALANMQWERDVGVLGAVDLPYLKELVAELERDWNSKNASPSPSPHR